MLEETKGQPLPQTVDDLKPKKAYQGNVNSSFVETDL
jgi:hypothetical protein